MEFRVLDDKFNVHAVIDQFESVIWTARSGEAGDFELYTPVTAEILDAVKIGYYFFSDLFYDQHTDKAKLMFIETIEIESDVENGQKIKVTGRDLKTILDRRIIWNQTTFKTKASSVYDIAKHLITDSILEPQDWSKTYQDGDTKQDIVITVKGEDRKISNFVFVEDTISEFPKIKEDIQYEGNTVYDALTELCTLYKFGFDVVYNFSTGNFEFSMILYSDRTYEQYANSPIMFSTAYENLKSGNYISSSANERTFGLVVGEGDENNRMFNIVGSGSGLTRKEIYISASDISRVNEDGKYEEVTPVGNENPHQLHLYEIIDEKYVVTTDTAVDTSKTYYRLVTEYGNRSYLSMLADKGNKTLKENKFIETYEGSVIVGGDFNYPGSFDINDIVDIVNEYNLSVKVLISEIVLSVSSSGYSVTPTFSIYTEDDDDEGGDK